MTSHSSSKRVIQLETPDGSVSWQPFSDRVEDMLLRFPAPDYGFRSKIESWNSRNDMVLVTASLIYHPREGGEPKVIAERNAFGVLRKIKDLEKIETAASQRLYAALGCAGQCFDDDEKHWAQDESSLPWNDEPHGKHGKAMETGETRFEKPPFFKN